MKKVMMLLVGVMMLAGTTMAEVKPKGTILPEYCGENVLEPYDNNYVKTVCISDRGAFNFLIVRYENLTTDYLYIMKAIPHHSPFYSTHIVSLLSVLRIAPDSRFPVYMTALSSEIKQVSDISIRRPFNVVELSGQTPTGSRFQVNDFKHVFRTL